MLKDLEPQWNQDFVSKDVGKLVAHYADNAVLMASGMPASTGVDAIRKTLTDFVADPNLSLKFQVSRAEVSKSGVADIASSEVLPPRPRSEGAPPGRHRD